MTHDRHDIHTDEIDQGNRSDHRAGRDRPVIFDRMTFHKACLGICEWCWRSEWCWRTWWCWRARRRVAAVAAHQNRASRGIGATMLLALGPETSKIELFQPRGDEPMRRQFVPGRRFWHGATHRRPAPLLNGYRRSGWPQHRCWQTLLGRY